MKEGGANSDYLSMNILHLVFFWSHILAPQLIFHLNSYKTPKKIVTDF